jgi:serine/threonine protein kinase
MSERKYLGNYRLIKQVGEGGYAQVYLGIHILLQVPVAIKLLHRVSSGCHVIREAFCAARMQPVERRVKDSWRPSGR